MKGDNGEKPTNKEIANTTTKASNNREWLGP